MKFPFCISVQNLRETAIETLVNKLGAIFVILKKMLFFEFIIYFIQIYFFGVKMELQKNISSVLMDSLVLNGIK